jgi:hypothetical protein
LPFRFRFPIEVACQHLLQHLVQFVHRVPDPDDALLLVYHEGGGDTVLPCGFHPGFGDDAFRAVHRNDIVHLIAHVLHELLHALDVGVRVFFVGAFPHTHPNNRDFVLVFLGEFGQVGDGLAARTTPGRPELYDIDLTFLELLDRLSLDPFGDGQSRSGIAHIQRLRPTTEREQHHHSS